MQGALVFLVALIVWVVTVLLSGVSVGGWFWGYVLPPVIILIGWAIYDAIDDRVEGHAGALYDRATGGEGDGCRRLGAPEPLTVRRDRRARSASCRTASPTSSGACSTSSARADFATDVDPAGTRPS